MKKLISIILSITLIGGIFGVIPVSATVYYNYTGKTTSADSLWVYITPEKSKKEIVVVSYKGSETEVVIPEKIDNKTVVGIGDIYIEGSYDDDYADYAATKLFSDSLNVTSVTLPKTVEEICDYFHGEIGSDEDGWDYAYISNYSIRPGEIKDIPSLSKSTIREFKVDPGNHYFTAVDGVLYNKDQTAIMRYPAGKATEQFTLPETTTEIGPYAFANANVEKVDANNLTHLSSYAFYKAKIQAVSNLHKVTTIPQGAFLNSEIKEFPDIENAREICEYAFAYCGSLKEVEISLRVDSLRDHAFYSCKKLKSVDFGKIIYIGAAAFAQCSVLEEADLPDTCRTIYSYGFSNCKKLKMVDLTRVESIESKAFNKCYALVSLNKDSSDNNLWEAKTIGHSAFKKCTSLKSIYFMEVETIDYAAFHDCTSLSDVGFGRSYPQKIYATSFDNTALVNNVKSGMVYIDQLALCYKAPKTPKSYIKIKEGTKYIADYCLYKLKGVKSIYLPKSVKYVYAVNLSSCKDLRRVYVGNKDIEFSHVSCQNKYTGNTTYYIKSNAYGAIKHFEEDECIYTTNWNPDKTKSLKAVGKTKTTAKITWKKQGYVTGYKVYMKTSKNGKWKKVATLKGSGSTSYTKKNLKKGKTYYFRMRAYKTVEGETYHGAYSKTDAAKTKK